MTPRQQLPLPEGGPFTLSADPISDVRAALERGVAPVVVARRFLPPIIRRRRLAALRRLLAEYGADAAWLAALQTELCRQETVR